MTEVKTNEKIRNLVQRAAAALRNDPPPKRRPADPYNFSVEQDSSRSTIGLPEGLTPTEAINVLALLAKRDGEQVSVYRELEGYPLDGAVQLARAMELVFGDVFTKVVKTMFGDQPPTMVTVPTGTNTSVQVPFGRLEFPNTDGGYLDVGLTMTGGFPALQVTGKFQRKYIEGVNAFLDIVEELIRVNSVYRGKAVRLDLSWSEDGNRFDPTGHAPKFRDVSKFDYEDIVLSDDARDVFERAILPRLRSREKLDGKIATFRSGFLFAGPYGTGKTLASGIIAKEATENGITFLYVEDPRHLPMAMRIAQMYAPAVVFVEDIERAAAYDAGDQVGGRSAELDNILNSVDGIDSKESEIMLVFTTNYPEKIYPGLLRAGRVDYIINMERLDATAIANFIKKFGGDLLAITEEELLEVAATAAGAELIPAAIKGVVSSALVSALSRGSDKIEAEDIAFALRTAVNHAVVEKKAIESQKEDNVLESKIAEWIESAESIKELLDKVSTLEENLV